MRARKARVQCKLWPGGSEHFSSQQGFLRRVLPLYWRRSGVADAATGEGRERGAGGEMGGDVSSMTAESPSGRRRRRSGVAPAV